MIFRNLTFCIFFLSIPSLLLAGCDLNRVDDSPESERELPRELSAQEKIVAEGSNTFSFDLLQMLNEKENGNSFFVSPLSISIAFGMALNGAEADTYEQMRDFFGYDGLTRDEINRAKRDLTELLTTVDPSVIMNIANSVWYREGFQVKDEFLEKNQNYYAAEVRDLDFSDPAAPDIINGWIEDKTEGLIKEMIEQIGPEVVMYLINAIYFKGDWTIQFDPEETQDAPFYLDNGETTEVPMMQAREKYRYYIDDEWTALDLWYGKAGFSFTALMPTEDVSLHEQAGGLTKEQFTSITSQLEADTVNIFMPKFELDYTIKGFPEDLKDMGLTLPFSDQANFTGISEGAPLQISDVLHRAVIKLDEEGSEAAAVTVIEFGITGGGGPSYKTIRLDRPFLFFIRENSTNTILFMGSYSGTG